jgi:hypothetical protein
MPEKSALLRAMQRWSWPWQGAQALWWGPSGLWHADGSPDGATHWDDLDAWCAAHPGQRASVWLSAWWVVDVLVDAALPLHDDAALLAYVRPLLQHYHGDAAAPWPLAAWQAGAARGASALHGLDLAAMQHTAQRHGVRLAALQPWWARALRLALARQPALAREPAAQLAVVEGRLVTRLDLARGQLVGLQQRRLPQASTAALQSWLADEPVALQCCLGHGLVDDLPNSHSTRSIATDSGLGSMALGRLDGLAPPPAWWAPGASGASLQAGATIGRGPRAGGHSASALGASRVAA